MRLQALSIVLSASSQLTFDCFRGCRNPIRPDEITLLAAYGASTLTRTASRMSFAEYKRAMQTGEMLGYVGRAFEEVFGTDSVSDQGISASEGMVDKLVGAIKGSL